MSEEQSPELDESIECSVCGKVGGPVVECQLCAGNQRFVQERHFTLTEERQGKNPDAAKRYGESGEIGPERVFGDVVLPKAR